MNEDDPKAVAASEQVLDCAECGRESDQQAISWRAIFADGIDDPDDCDVVFAFCPVCAAREFDAD